MSKKSQASYRAILKANSLFGSIQGFNILFSLIKTKVIALLLGSSGIGILGLYNATLAVISEFAKLGLDTSAVKELSFALNKKKGDDVPEIVSALNKIILVFGLFIAGLMVLFSTYLSRFTFGNDTYKWSFVFLTLVIIFNLLTAVKLSVLQGLRQLKALAKVNVLSSFLSLLFVIPLYYFLEFKGMVVALIVSAGINYGVSWFFVNKLAIKKVKQSSKKAFLKYKPMIKLGLMFSLSGVIALITAYLIRVSLGYFSTIEMVGFYTAGMLILEAYFGLIYKAIQTDYFPRISAINNQKLELSKVVSQQAVIGVLIIIPIIILFMAFMPHVLELLYTEKFIILTQFMNWALLGLLFKTASWTIGITIIAKADTNLFIKTSIVFNSLLLSLSLLGFYFFNLEGVGFAYFLYYILHFIGLVFITKWRYQLNLNRTFNLVFLVGLLLCSLSFCCTFIHHSVYRYLFSILLFLIGLAFSTYKLHKIANLTLFFKSLFRTTK